MKIIQLNCVYDNGSTGKIVSTLHRYYLKKGISSKVIYGRGENCEEEGVARVSGEVLSKARNFVSRYTGNLYGMGAAETKKICAFLEKEKPDIVHLHCINGYFCNIFSLLDFLKEKNIPTVLTLHAEFMYTGNCGYAFECEQWKSGCKSCPDVKSAISSSNKKAPARNWKKMHNAFCGFDNLWVTGVSDWISERARASEILKDKKITTVLNGLDTDVFNASYEIPKEIEKIKKEGKKVLLYVTPYFEDENKGGKWILELAERIKKEKTQIVVAGNYQNTYDKDNITFLGQVKSAKELAAYYAYSDLCLLTSKRETFSMVCAEALCCGTPIVGFKAGAPEMIALKEYSEFVDYGDLDALEAAIKKWLAKDIDKNRLLQIAAAKYSKESMAEGYIEIYNEMLEKKDE